MSSEDDKKQSDLKKNIDLQSHNKKYAEAMAELRRKTDKKTDESTARQTKRLEKHQKKTNKEYQKIEKAKENYRDANIHMSSVASMLMDAAPRLETLAWYFCSKKRELTTQAGIAMTSSWHKTHKAYHDVEQYFSSGEPVDIPDLKYFTEVAEDGTLSQHWIGDSFDGLFDDEDGNYSEENAKEVQAELQTAVVAWIETLNEPQAPPNDAPPHGYFIGPNEGDDNNPQFRLYPKNVGKQPPHGGAWILDEAKVQERYEDHYCKRINGVLTPIPEAPTKAGFEPLYVQPEQFKKLRENTDHPEKSLGSFLEDRFDDVTIGYEPSKGMTP
jgi:hypothetical protein